MRLEKPVFSNEKKKNLIRSQQAPPRPFRSDRSIMDTDKLSPSKAKESFLQQPTSSNEFFHTSLDLVEPHGTASLAVKAINQATQNLEVFGAISCWDNGTMLADLITKKRKRLESAKQSPKHASILS